MALGADDVQPAGADDGVVTDLPLGTQYADLRLPLRRRERLVLAQLEDLRLDRPAQHDVRPAPGHVRRDRHRLGAAGLRDDLGLARMLLRVQHLVRKLFLRQVAGQHLRVLDRSRPDQHGLPALVTVPDVGDDRIDLLLQRPEHLVVLVLAHHRHVRRDYDRLQVVDLLEFERLGVSGAGHAGELAVHPEQSGM